MNLPAFTIWFEALAGWVWKTSIYASVLIALVLIAQGVFGRWLKPKWRYALGLLVLIRLAMPDVPPSEFSIFNLGRQPAMPPGIAEFPMTAPPRAAPSEGEIEIASQGRTTAQRRALLPVVLRVAWAMGCAGLLLVVVRQHWRFSRRVRDLAPVTEAAILSLLGECRAMMRVRKAVAIVRSDHPGTPALFGFLSPVLIVPEAVLQKLGPRELRLVFLHEMAHLKRGDVLLNWAIIIARALHWFNPLVWIAMKRLRADRELVCDEMVMGRLNPEERHAYGSTLIKLAAEFSKARFCPSLVPAINGKHEIKRRIVMISQFKPAGRVAAIASAALVGIIGGFTFTRAVDDAAGPTFIADEAARQDGQPGKISADGAKEGDHLQDLSKGASNGPAIIQVLEKEWTKQQVRVAEAQERVDKLRKEFSDLSDLDGGGVTPSLESESLPAMERVRVEARAQAAYYDSLLKQFAGKSRSELRNLLPTVFPDVQLNELSTMLAKAENELVMLSNDFSPEHPKMRSATALVQNLNSQIESRVDGILSGLKALANAQEARAEVIANQAGEARLEYAEQMKRYRPYLQARRDLEAQQRIRDQLGFRLIQEKVDAALPKKAPPGGAMDPVRRLN